MPITRIAPSRPAPEPSEEERSEPWGMPEWFIISQTAFPAMMFLPGTQAFRLPIRVASFAISLGALGWVFMKKKDPSASNHPAAKWLWAAAGLLFIMILHPTTNGWKAGLAQTMLYISVLAPVFWAADMVKSVKHLKRMIWLLLICNGINSFVGIMQVYDPNRWLPAEFSKVYSTFAYGFSALVYHADDGRVIIRPPGLFDSPGAVCGPGMFAGFFGVALCLIEQKWWQRILAAGFAFCGVSAIYLTLVRSNLVVLMGSLIVFAYLQQVQRSTSRTVMVLLLSAGIGIGGFALAKKFGGKSITERVKSLVEESPGQVYYRNRGGQMEHGFKEMLPKYPLGAGLGRWGMMAFYFGRKDAPPEEGLWAEIMFPAWILDGGIILMFLYCGALVVTVRAEYVLSRSSPDPDVQAVSACVLAGNAAIVALCFSFVPFVTQVGLQFWFLSACLRGAIQPSIVGPPTAVLEARVPEWKRLRQGKLRPK